MKGRVKELLQELKDNLTRIYEHHLRGVYLYGSYVRGEADDESDIDILVVLDDFEHYGREVERTGQVASDLSLKYDVSISEVFIRERDWLRGETPFVAEVREEAVHIERGHRKVSRKGNTSDTSNQLDSSRQ